MDSRTLIGALQDVLLKQLAALTEGHETVALLDFPKYTNIGDSLIWLGQLRLLKLLGKKIVYVCSYDDWNEEAMRRQLEPSSAILLQGGGNFGDLWPVHHEFRLEIIRRFPRHRIIQLPQSIYFGELDVLTKSKAVLDSHPDLHLMTRDATSHALAKSHFTCPVLLSPDAAFMIGPVKRRKPVTRLFLLLRTDKERKTDADNLVRVLDDVPVRSGDWLHELSSVKRLSRLYRAAQSLLPSERLRMRAKLWMTFFVGAARLREGIRLLSQGELGIYDRLHAHILGVLLDLPHVALDNSNGKISSFYSEWTHRYSGSRLISDMAEIPAALDQLSGRKNWKRSLT